MIMIICKQVDPGYQDSYFDDTYNCENFIIDGNGEYKSFTTALFDRIIECYDELSDEYENLKARNQYAVYGNITEAINAYFPALEYRDKQYSKKDIHAIKAALELYGTDSYYRGKYIVNMLTAISGKPWKMIQITGICQGDWNNLYYPADELTQNDIDRIECEYFNTGMEWKITDESDESDVFYCYTHGYRIDDIRQEIADHVDTRPENLKLYEFDGYTKTEKYKEVTE